MSIQPFVTNTERLFLLLLRVQRCDAICDVGSLDGTHAKRFRRIRPRARIFAFEANPRNVEAMDADTDLHRQGIELQGVAVGDRDGPVTFHVVSGPEGRRWKSLSSTRVRTNTSSGWWRGLESTPQRVDMIRLDSILSDVTGDVALWIDVEGGTFEVLQGARVSLDRVRIVHAEVETEEIFVGQKTETHVRDFMERRGFEFVAYSPGDEQRNVVFVRRDPPKSWLLSVMTMWTVRCLLPVWRLFKRLPSRTNQGRGCDPGSGSVPHNLAEC